MAYTQTVPVGRSFDMVEDVVYALPAGHWAYSSSGSGTIEFSDDGSTWATATSPVVATWVRSHSDDATIRIQHY